MLVTKTNIDFILTSLDNDLILSYDLSYDEIISIIKNVSYKETIEKKHIYNICFQKDSGEFNTDKLILVYKYLINIDNINNTINDSIILNIMSLIKPYNTFNDAYFNDPRIYISSIEQYLDIKIALLSDILLLMNMIGTYFISLFRSLSKTEYTILDSYIELPDFFKAIFLSNDLITISSILSTIPSDYAYLLKYIKGAHLYISLLIGDYNNASIMMTDFFNSMKQNN